MDEIQQKIEEFKQSLTSQSPLKEIFLSCPAVLPAIGLTLGLVLQYYLDFPLFIWFIILILSLVLFLSHKFLIRSVYLVFISVLLCFICLGSFRLINHNLSASNDIRKIAKQDFTFAHIRAQIVTEPIVVKQGDWLFSKFSQSYPYTHFYAKVTAVKTIEGWKPATGKIKFYISEDANNLKIGNDFQTFCRLKEFSPPDNPGQFDTARYMNHNGVYLSASVKSKNAITILNTAASPKPFDIKAKLRQYAVAALLENTESNDYISLTEALVLGSRTKIDRQLYNDFIKTGLVHLVCLSGLNVGIFAGVAWWLSKKAGLLHQGRSIACIIATIIFLLIVPAQSPTLRAGIMFIIFCLGRLFNRRSIALNSLAISAIFLLLVQPIDFLNPGFELSFVAMLGILLFYEPISKFLSLPAEPLRETPFYPLLRMPLDMFAVGLAAWLAVIPIIAWHFYQFQLLTAVWTVPAMIPATVMIVLGTFKILLNPLLPTLACGLGFIIDFSAGVLSYLVTLFAKVPFSNVTTGKPSIYIVLFFYLLLFLWKFFPFRKSAKNFIYPAAILLLLISAVSVKYFKNLNNLKLTVLSVGHGQAIYAGLPDGKNIIIDAGSMTKSNIGDNIVNPFLNYIATGKIDSAFISHDDIDHYNGLPEILDKHKCKNIYTTLQFIQSAATSAADANLSRFISSKGLSLEISPEKILMDKVRITRLWPKEMTVEPDFTDNQASLVLLLEYAGRKIMFCSDMTKDVQNQFINLYPALDIDIMVVPHHGSAVTLSLPFLNTFKPEFFITSCAQSQFGRISLQVLNFPNSFYTCRDGAVTVLIDPAGQIKVSTFK